ncbi:MAG: hypothetical protein JWQ04_2607 [Pedosphaera sp.]|nr:hypothetical protein [Pedosphaera sp.]
MQASLIKFLAVATAVSAAPFALRAQNDGDSDWNHFGMDARMGFNIRAKFLNQGAMAAPASPAAGGAVNRAYTDGFVNTDVSGNQGGLTWNWGYKNAAQAPGNDTLLFHASAVDGATSSRADDPSLGFELSYLRDVVHADWGSWGVKASFGYSRINLSDNQPQTANFTQITDAYALGGIQVPMAPYNGSFNGPGPVIGSTPTRTATVTPGGASIIGSRGIDANLFDFHLGPSADFRLSNRLSLQVGGGLALGLVASKFSFAETTTTPAGTVAASGSSHDTDCLVGAYAEAELAYRFWRSASVFVGAEFQYLGDFHQSAAGHDAQLDLSQTIFCKAGFQWKF